MNPLENLPPFYVGQKVVYVFEGNWHDVQTNEPAVGPKKGEIVTVTCLLVDGEWCLKALEYSSDDWFPCFEFKPLQESPFPSLTYERVIEKESVLTSMN